MSAESRVDGIIAWMQRVQHASMQDFKRLLLDEFREAESDVVSNQVLPERHLTFEVYKISCPGADDGPCRGNRTWSYNGTGKPRVRCRACTARQYYINRRDNGLQKASSGS